LDTSSEDRVKSIAKNYLKGANGFIIMYNMTIRESFENAEYWLMKIRNNTTNNNIVLVGSHMDADNGNGYHKM